MAPELLDSPYPIGSTVRDQRLLQLRRFEIDRGLEIVAPEGERQTLHGVILGEPHSGRTSILAEVARRAGAERKRLVVKLRSGEDMPLSEAEITRHLLIAVVEALAAHTDPDGAEWYRAWRDRVYLRNQRPADKRDLLSSALLLAADHGAAIDRPVLERDLSEIAEVARAAGVGGIVVCIDDVQPLTEDVPLVERLVDVFDSVGFYSLLMAGLPAVADHFTEAASRCLERVSPVWLEPFFTPHQIFTALSAPLPDQTNFICAEDNRFLRDLLNLTGGNPYELMVVGHYLWISCENGEQETYALTPRLLDRVIPHLALRTTDGDALRDGAEAIDCLPEEQVKGAVELAGLSNLSIREVAINRLLKGANRRSIPADRVPADITQHLDEEIERTEKELSDLQEHGVVALDAEGGRFSIVGGRPTSVLLKYKAQARIGEPPSGLYGVNFILTAGQPLARSLAVGAIKALPKGVQSLGFAMTSSERGAGSRSLRPAVRSVSTSGEIDRLVSSEAEILPWNSKTDRLKTLVADDDARLALVCTSLSYGRGQFEYLELWELPEGLGDRDLSAALSEVSESWQPLVGAAELTWGGVESAVISGETARKTICALENFVAARATFQLFGEWKDGKDETGLLRAIRTVEESVEVMRTGARSDLELGGELSASYSRLGFLQSLDDDSLEQARANLEEAKRIGSADRWVTDWNLANIASREGDREGALRALERSVDAYSEPNAKTTILVHVPGRAPVDSLAIVGPAGIPDLFKLQRALIAAEADELAEAIQMAGTSGDPAVVRAAQWADQAMAQATRA